MKVERPPQTCSEGRATRVLLFAFPQSRSEKGVGAGDSPAPVGDPPTGTAERTTWRKSRLHWLARWLPFRPASRLGHRKMNSQTRSRKIGGSRGFARRWVGGLRQSLESVPTGSGRRSGIRAPAARISDELLPRRRGRLQGEGKKLPRLRARLPLPIRWGEGWGEGKSRATIHEVPSAVRHEAPSPWPSPRPTGRDSMSRRGSRIVPLNPSSASRWKSMQPPGGSWVGDSRHSVVYLTVPSVTAGICCP